MATAKRGKKRGYSKLEKIREVEDLLLEEPRTRREVQLRTGLEPRTVGRYLDELGAEMVDPTVKTPLYRLPKPDLEEVEALVAHSALRLLHHHTPGYNPVYVAALQKLARQLPKHARKVALDSTTEGKNHKLDEGNALEVVAKAWFNRQVLEFFYKKPGGSGKEHRNELEVYFLEVSRDNLGLYVIGHERGYHQAVRTFKLNRMRRPRLLGEAGAYEVDPEFAKYFLSNAWGVMGNSGGGPVEVRLLFDKDAAYRLEEGGYPSGLEIVQRHKDKSLEVVVRVGTDNEGFPKEIFPWVQSWGKRVTVLFPENLRQKWLEEASFIHKKYVRDST